MESSLLSRKASSHALFSGPSVSGGQLGVEHVGTRNLLNGFAATTKPTTEDNPEGNDGEKSNISLELSPFSKDKTKVDETESQHGLEVSLKLELGWPSNCVTNKRKENESSANLSGSSTACGTKKMKLLGCPDPLELKLSQPDPWAIKKTIETSDIGHLSRLLFKKKEVEKHILPMWDARRIESIDDGVRVAVWDFDTESEHELIFKKRPSNGSYVLIGNWTNEFVKRRILNKGDEIGLYWDQTNSRFNFTILKEAANIRATSIAGELS